MIKTKIAKETEQKIQDWHQRIERVVIPTLNSEERKRNREWCLQHTIDIDQRIFENDYLFINGKRLTNDAYAIEREIGRYEGVLRNELHVSSRWRQGELRDHIEAVMGYMEIASHTRKRVMERYHDVVEMSKQENVLQYA